MSVSSYVRFDGIPGPINGGVNDKHAELYEFRYEVNLPIEPDGTIRGRRQHGLFSFVHELDIMSPLLFRRLCENQIIPSVTFSHRKPDSDGGMTSYFFHELTDVRVVGIVSWKPNLCDPASKFFRDLEKVDLMFEEIRVFCNEVDGDSTEYTDKWKLR